MTDTATLARLAALPPHARREALAGLSTPEAEILLHDWSLWARPEQRPPPPLADGPWFAWLYLAGRGAGKTRAGAEWVRARIAAGSGRLALVAPTAADARDVMVEGESGLLAVSHRLDRDPRGRFIGRPRYEPSKRRVTWANGATATLFSAEEPDRLRGPQHEAAWADELAAWGDLETWDMLLFGLRLGDTPQVVATTTPRPIPLLRELLADPRAVVTRGTTFDNAANLAPAFLRQVEARYGSTRLGRQELYAEILDDVPGALWTRKRLDETRRRGHPELARVVVAVDPAVAAAVGDDRTAETGIVTAGVGLDGQGYVLADDSLQAAPEHWARRAVAAYRAWQADRVVAEQNNGGDMVRAVIQAVDPKVPVKLVSASRGKLRRAEPISALYEQGRVHHVGHLAKLEDQLALFDPATQRAGDCSPDRLDALVWALTELFPQIVRRPPPNPGALPRRARVR